MQFNLYMLYMNSLFVNEILSIFNDRSWARASRQLILWIPELRSKWSADWFMHFLIIRIVIICSSIVWRYLQRLKCDCHVCSHIIRLLLSGVIVDMAVVVVAYMIGYLQGLLATWFAVYLHPLQHLSDSAISPLQWPPPLGHLVTVADPASLSLLISMLSHFSK